MNNRGSSSNTELQKTPNKCRWIILGAQPVGVAYITLLLAPGKGSSKHLCLKCQQLGLVPPSPTDPLKLCQLQLVRSMPYSSWKMLFPSGNSAISQRPAKEK